MGFLSGRASFVRFHLDHAAPKLFGPEQLERLAEYAIGKQRQAEKDGTEMGWIAGDDILDLDFDLAKNIVNDALLFALRVDVAKLPTDLLRSYARIELRALAADNPSGRPSAYQKRQAREAARDRLEAEAKDGRYTKRKAYPVLWDLPTNTLLVGSMSAGVLGRVTELFKLTFQRTATLQDATTRAQVDRYASKKDYHLQPAQFVPAAGFTDVAWIKDPGSANYLGNEFVLWLWHMTDDKDDVIELGDKSEVTVMLARRLKLECPRGQSGSESIASEAPAQLPEARRAVQTGKWPRQTGLVLARHGQQYELTLQPELLAVGGAKLPFIEEEEERARLEERISQLRHLIETLDLLYDAYVAKRLSKEWPGELERMQTWLKRLDRGQRTATAAAAAAEAL
jgi:hypothetical protein